jgi:hypothetical protein
VGPAAQRLEPHRRQRRSVGRTQHGCNLAEVSFTRVL